MFAVLLVASFFSSLYYFCGTATTLTTFLVYLAIPPIVLYKKNICPIFFLNKFRTPFLNLKNIKEFGINGGRYFTVKFNSKVDKREIELAGWHILPKSLVDKTNALSDNPENAEEIKQFFDDQLKHSQKPIVLYCHGITQTIADRHRRALYKIFQELDLHVITFDYRGYGDSTDVIPTKMGLVEDFFNVYSWVQSIAGESPVFLWGHSMGASIVLKSLSKLEEYSNSLLDSKTPLEYPRGVFLESTFHKLGDCIVYFFLIQVFMIIPYYMEYTRYRFATDPNISFDNCKYIKAVKNLPVLHMHARDDNVVPFRFGKVLYETAVSVRTKEDPPYTFLEFQEGSHMWICHQDKVPTYINDFIELHKNKG